MAVSQEFFGELHTSKLLKSEQILFGP